MIVINGDPCNDRAEAIVENGRACVMAEIIMNADALATNDKKNWCRHLIQKMTSSAILKVVLGETYKKSHFCLQTLTCGDTMPGAKASSFQLWGQSRGKEPDPSPRTETWGAARPARLWFKAVHPSTLGKRHSSASRPNGFLPPHRAEGPCAVGPVQSDRSSRSGLPGSRRCGRTETLGARKRASVLLDKRGVTDAWAPGCLTLSS
ncbi:Protein Transport Protein Sec31B [Manis pentadactyla]|nr:Protein Transport Protein Sec31B [Manis pentadactyla]